MNKKIVTLLFVIFLTACASPDMSQYTYPGYYQPAQYQASYMSEGSLDALGNYHPPLQKGGQYIPGRWYRAQPGNPGPSPQKVYARENSWATTLTQISKMNSDGDVATTSTCRYRSC